MSNISDYYFILFIYFWRANQGGSLPKKKKKHFGMHPQVIKIHKKTKNPIYIYINKDGNPSTKSTRYVETNVNTRKENWDNKKNNNKVEDIMLKRYPLPQIS